MNDTITNLVFYRSSKGDAQVQLLFRGEDFWMTQKAIGELFGVGVPAVSKHLKNIFDSGELSREATVSILETVRREGTRDVTRQLEHYNLDVVIAVGYRVSSYPATQFRVHEWVGHRVNSSRRSRSAQPFTPPALSP